MYAIHCAGISYSPFPESATEIKTIVPEIIQNQSPDLPLGSRDFWDMCGMANSYATKCMM